MRINETRGRRGMAIAMVLLGVVLTSVIVGSIVRYSMQGNRLADRTLDKKSAYYVAEAGLSFATKELMKTPFFNRFILRDFVEFARQGMGRPANQVGLIPADWGAKTYGPINRSGAKQIGGLGWAQLTGQTGKDSTFEVTLVEHVSQDFITKRAGLPGAGNVDPVKARLDHIAVYSRGRFNDPYLGETWALVTAKICFRPEPFVFEYDSNGDGISNPVKLAMVTEKGQKIPPPTTYQARISDLVYHPFLEEGRWAVWGSGNFQSSPPTNFSVIKSKVFYQTIADRTNVKSIRDLRFAANNALVPASGGLTSAYLKNNAIANNDRAFVQTVLKEDNLKFVNNFGTNKPVRDAFLKAGATKNLVDPGTQAISQDKMESIVDSAAGGKLEAASAETGLNAYLQDWVDSYTRDLPTYGGQTAYGTGAGKAKLTFIEDTSLGKPDTMALNLGKVFKIPAADLAKLNKLVDAFRGNQIKNGENLLALQPKDAGENALSRISDLTGAQEFYAPVVFPRGRAVMKTDQVPDGNAIPDLNGNKVCDKFEIDAYMKDHPELNGKPPMASRETWSIDNSFVERLKAAPLDDAAAEQLYADMQQAVQEIRTGPASKDFTADLSPRPPSFAQMEHTVVLQAQADPKTQQKDPRLDIPLRDALKEALKWAEVPGAENGESGEVAPVAVSVGITYSMSWLCFCKDNAESKGDMASREGKRSASAGGVAR
jgi:hypothetical protein